jgi:hypothetical protein
MEIYSEKISKNWKTRMKKPPDKLVKILMSSCSIKEFNKWKNESNIQRRSLEKEKISSKIEEDNSGSNSKFGKFNLGKKIVEHEYRTLLMKNGQHSSLGEFVIIVLGKNSGVMISEGERENSKCSVYTTESEGVSQRGQGYVILIKNNNHNAHGEGICWSNYLASATNRVGSEAEVNSVIEG